MPCWIGLWAFVFTHSWMLETDSGQGKQSLTEVRRDVRTKKLD